jgi:hypothetical protein
MERVIEDPCPAWCGSNDVSYAWIDAREMLDQERGPEQLDEDPVASQPSQDSDDEAEGD